MSLTSYLQAIPKVELHVHLEGSIQPATLLELAARNGVALPAADVAGLRRWFTFRDFDHFIEVYITITRCLRRVEDYELLVAAFAAELARQNVRYAEATFSPSTHDRLGVSQTVYMEGLSRGRGRARAEYGVELAWIFDIVRNDREDYSADYTTRVAIEGLSEGVVALGLGGPEAGHPPERFAPWFAQARAAGLHSIPHAGEFGGPESIWGALRALGAERLGHGVRAIEDPALVAHLAEQAIPIEVSPTSNICLGVYPSLEEHPLARLHAAGVPVTINSDDPPLFNTTLTDEMRLLESAFGLDRSAIDEIVLAGVRHSFLPSERRQALAGDFSDEMATLRAVLLAGD